MVASPAQEVIRTDVLSQAGLHDSGQEPAQPRSGDLSGSTDELHGRVPHRHAVLSDHRRQVAAVADVEEHPSDADEPELRSAGRSTAITSGRPVGDRGQEQCSDKVTAMRIDRRRHEPGTLGEPMIADQWWRPH